MNINKIILWTTGLALVTTALVAQGFGPGMMGGGRGQGSRASCFQGGPMARFLNLTEAQQTSLKGIEEKHKAALDAEFKAAGEARDAMRNAMRDPAMSDAKVKELHTKMADAMTAVMLEHRAMEREFQALLTPDQKAILDKRLQGGPGQGCGMGHGRGMRGQGRGGCGFWGDF